MCAGAAGALGNNGIGTSGVNWNAKLMPVKISNASSIPATNTAVGIRWAADNNAKILSMSFSFASDSSTIKSAIDYAYSKGCALFAAASNDGVAPVLYPARYSNVMAIGATGGTTRTSYSNYGDGLNVMANGSWFTTSTSSNSAYTIASGTSLATPQAAGAASLILSVNPNLTVPQLYQLMQDTAKKPQDL